MENKIKELRDGLNMDIIKKYYPWLLDAEFENAVIGMSKNKIVWYRGVWKKGIWKDGEWKYGTWISGVWLSGLWWDGIWKDGIWENGMWLFGIWENGKWLNGIWEDKFNPHPNKR
jgi:hypothetical protein